MKNKSSLSRAQFHKILSYSLRILVRNKNHNKNRLRQLSAIDRQSAYTNGSLSSQFSRHKFGQQILYCTNFQSAEMTVSTILNAIKLFRVFELSCIPISIFSDFYLRLVPDVPKTFIILRVQIIETYLSKSNEVLMMHTCSFSVWSPCVFSSLQTSTNQPTNKPTHQTMQHRLLHHRCRRQPQTRQSTNTLERKTGSAVDLRCIVRCTFTMKTLPPEKMTFEVK